MNKPITHSELEQHIQTASSTFDAANIKRKALRKKLLVGLLATVVISGAGYFGYAELGSSYVTTDNAYVGADTAQVTPLINGPVREVFVRDTDVVAQGDMLIQLDDTDARIAVAQAEAALGQAERHVRGYFANDEGLSAQVSARIAEQARAAADVASAESTLKRARIYFERRKALSISGAVSGDEVTATEDDLRRAEAALDAARANRVQAAANHEAAIGSLKANTVLTRDTTVETNPEVANARAPGILTAWRRPSTATGMLPRMVHLTIACLSLKRLASDLTVRYKRKNSTGPTSLPRSSPDTPIPLPERSKRPKDSVHSTYSTAIQSNFCHESLCVVIMVTMAIPTMSTSLMRKPGTGKPRSRPDNAGTADTRSKAPINGRLARAMAPIITTNNPIAIMPSPVPTARPASMHSTITSNIM